MTAQPHWSPMDDTTADLLTLVRDKGHVSAEWEWRAFLGILSATAAEHDGIVSPNDCRELLRGVVAPKRIAAFYSAAARSGLLERAGWVESTDVIGRNRGIPCRTYRWLSDLT